MSYTPINWDETTPITPVNLDNMDSQIDDNDGRITTNEGNISNLQVLSVPIEEVENFSGTNTQSGIIGINDNMIILGVRLYAYAYGENSGAGTQSVSTSVSITIDGEYGEKTYNVTAERNIGGSGSGSTSNTNTSINVEFAVSSISINYSTDAGDNINNRNHNAEVKIFYIDYS